jgi:hypothetical protein
MIPFVRNRGRCFHVQDSRALARRTPLSRVSKLAADRQPGGQAYLAAFREGLAPYYFSETFSITTPCFGT